MRIPSLAAAIALATTGAFALDQAQIESVFPGQTNLTGDTKKLRAFQFTVITNASKLSQLMILIASIWDQPSVLKPERARA